MNSRLMRNGLIFLVSFLTGLALFVPVFAGTADGGGGDAIKCNDGKLYSWDYIQTQAQSNVYIAKSYINAKSAKIIMDTIQKILAEKLPVLGLDLKDFVLLNTDPIAVARGKTQRLWTNGSGSLIDIKDEGGFRVPKNCLSSQGKPNLFQAVVRTVIQNRFSQLENYDADTTILAALNKNSPLQLSFLYIHEWLRSYTDDESVIMKINNLLHQNTVHNLSAEELVNLMSLLGFKARGGGMLTPSQLAEKRLVYQERIARLNNILKAYENAKSDCRPEAFREIHSFHIEVANMVSDTDRDTNYFKYVEDIISPGYYSLMTDTFYHKYGEAVESRSQYCKN